MPHRQVLQGDVIVLSDSNRNRARARPACCYRVIAPRKPNFGETLFVIFCYAFPRTESLEHVPMAQHFSRSPTHPPFVHTFGRTFYLLLLSAAKVQVCPTAFPPQRVPVRNNLPKVSITRSQRHRSGRVVKTHMFLVPSVFDDASRFEGGLEVGCGHYHHPRAKQTW